MEITKELRELARFTAGAMSVLSVYLDTQWCNQTQWERVATFVTMNIVSRFGLVLSLLAYDLLWIWAGVLSAGDGSLAVACLQP